MEEMHSCLLTCHTSSDTAEMAQGACDHVTFLVCSADHQQHHTAAISPSLVLCKQAQYEVPQNLTACLHAALEAEPTHKHTARATCCSEVTIMSVRRRRTVCSTESTAVYFEVTRVSIKAHVSQHGGRPPRAAHYSSPGQMESAATTPRAAWEPEPH